MRRVAAAALLLLASPWAVRAADPPAAPAPQAAAAPGDWAQRWSSLWQTPDQRGDELLRQGAAAAAAQTYRDPRRQAYAQLQAGDYADAAKAYAAFDDAAAHYNRGNALARAGDLQGALDAYDRALERAPDNADARHNRELVEQALKQQQAQPPPPSSGDSGGSDGDPQQQDAQDSAQSGEGGTGSQDPSGADRDGGEDGDQGGADAAQQQADATSGQDGGQEDGRDGGQGEDADASSQEDPGQQNGAGSRTADASPPAGDVRQQTATDPDDAPAGDDAEQARNDVAASAAQAAEDSAREDADTQRAATVPAGGDASPATPGDATATAAAPMSEADLAQEQWLRHIPDDPGGLLRRKFMIEHLMRQQEAQR